MLKEKHKKVRIEQCKILATASSCSRRKFGALLLDPHRNAVLADGYNGPPRGACGHLCGGDSCERDTYKVPSGQRMEVGCHHAEQNCICNAAASGTSTKDTWMIVSGEPCKMCAKLIHHAGVVKIIIIGDQYTQENGIVYLKQNGVEVEYYEEE